MKFEFAIFRYFPHGGVQRDMAFFTAEAIRRGHEVTIYAAQWQGAVPAGAQLKMLHVRGVTNHNRLKYFAYLLNGIPRQGLRVGFNRMENLDAYFAGDNCFALQSRRKRFWQRLFTTRYRVFEHMEAAVYAPEAKTEILYLTERQRQECQSVYQTPQERFHLLPPGIDVSRKRPGADLAAQVRRDKREALGIGHVEHMLLSVGSGFRTKGVDRSLEALARLPEALRNTVRLVIVGHESSHRFQHLAQQLKIEERVLFLGPREDVGELLLAADLLVHSARNEATGTVLVEALAAGLPAVVTGCCGYADFIRDSGGVVLPEPFAVEALAENLTQVLAQPGKLAQMQLAAQHYGAQADFYNRATCAVNLLEQFVRRRGLKA